MNEWKPCSRCTTPDYCTNQLRGCDIRESLEAGIVPLAAPATPPRISRDEMLMRVAMLVAQRGTCNRLQVGAVIALEGRIISTGYVGAPAGMPHCSPETCNTTTPCTRTLHAEANAIAWAARLGLPLLGSTLYTTHSPCFDMCAKLIINAGIKRVVYGTEYRKTEGIELLRSVGIAIEQWRAPQP